MIMTWYANALHASLGVYQYYPCPVVHYVVVYRSSIFLASWCPGVILLVTNPPFWTQCIKPLMLVRILLC